MEKEQLIKALEGLIEQIKAEKPVEPEQPKREKRPFTDKPDVGDRYWYLDSCMRRLPLLWDGDDIDETRYLSGNVFHTEEQAGAHRRHVLAVAAWNRIAGERVSGEKSVSYRGRQIASDTSTIRLVVGSDARGVTELFLNEGYKLEDLFIYALEERE